MVGVNNDRNGQEIKKKIKMNKNKNEQEIKKEKNEIKDSIS